MIRIAAVGDVHFGLESAGTLRPHLEDLSDKADALLIAGDLTRHGAVEEARVLAGELRNLSVPMIAVLGNHDYHLGQEREIYETIRAAEITVLECSTTTLTIRGAKVGVAGAKGFGGGFAGACGTEFGEPEMKDFIRHTRTVAEGLRRALASLNSDIKVALTHYAPVNETLAGERREIYPFLGSYLLGEAIDTEYVSLVVHGHAHAGREKGVTPGGVQVRNVALPVIGAWYKVYDLHPASHQESEQELAR